jgi:peptidyl-prolyl cis-trans isomerase A (cyclophilin A)
MFFKSKPIFFAVILLALLSLKVQSTVIEIRTSLGTIEVNLFDTTTPVTVANFLSYVNSGAYASHVVHRSVPGFVIQGGGFLYTGPIDAQAAINLDSVIASSPVINEPELSNVRGTIAMAKIGGQPNSATSQWFINLSNTNVSLDTNNGGFSVFGQVLGDGMQIVDAIASLSRVNRGGAFAEFPIRNINDAEFNDDDVVLIEDIVVTDSAIDTNSNIAPVINTRINQPTTDGNADSGGGGSTFWLALMTLCSIQVRRRFK